MQKSLDAKLDDIRANPNSDAFIIAYAADSDMSGGVATFEPNYSIQMYCETLVDLVEQAKIDILLTSVSSMDILAREKRCFDDSTVTPAIRSNDTTDLWGARGAKYASEPSRPFATATIEEGQYGTLLPTSDQTPDVDLGLYSVTFNNDLDADWFHSRRSKTSGSRPPRRSSGIFSKSSTQTSRTVGFPPKIFLRT